MRRSAHSILTLPHHTTPPPRWLGGNAPKNPRPLGPRPAGGGPWRGSAPGRRARAEFGARPCPHFGKIPRPYALFFRGADPPRFPRRAGSARGRTHAATDR